MTAYDTDAAAYAAYARRAHAHEFPRTYERARSVHDTGGLVSAVAVIPAVHAALVSESYARIHPRAPAMTVAFFSRLHAEAPRFRLVFPPKDAAKRALAKEMFDLVVASLRSSEDLRPLLERMGRRGLLDGANDRELAAIGSCLIATLAEFDARWNGDTARAWASVYEWAADAVRSGDAARRSIVASRR